MRAPILKPKVTLKRSYKDFNIEAFLKDIGDSNLKKEVVAKNNVEEAAIEFEVKFKDILDKHAPIKVYPTEVVPHHLSS